MFGKKIGSFDIFGIPVSKIDNQELIDCIKDSIEKNQKLTIAYANANSLNKVYVNNYLKKIYNSFDIIHPDGIGIFLASKFLYGKNGLEERLTGSDFYITLIEESLNYNWKYFFFGHDKCILENITKVYPALNIVGLQEGYNFNNSEVTEYININNPDIIIIGLSCPIQEEWMYDNKNKISFKIILAVGDGIKIFANKKIRGPIFLRSIGLEWFSRYLTSPFSNFFKYIIGNPLFIYRVFKEKVKNL